MKIKSKDSGKNKASGKRNAFGRKKIIIRSTVIGALVIPLAFGWTTPAPAGTSYSSPVSSVSDIRLIYDLTYRKGSEVVHDQKILEEELNLIREAKKFVVADIFLYNDYHNIGKYEFPASTQRLTNTLIEQKKKYPDLKAYVITDEINNSYGTVMNEQFRQLEENGISVVITDLSKIRDSNPVYAGYYRTYIKHFGVGGKGWLKNPFGENGPDVNIRNYLRMLNFKANHRKVLITDDAAMVTSANPHDGSVYHSNIAFKFRGEAVSRLLDSEKAVAAFSGTKIDGIEYHYDPTKLRKDTKVLILTEDKIRDKVLESIEETEAGDEIDMGMFYLSHRGIISQLIEAADRGVKVRVILDPNKDAFGFEKSGIPNRQTAAELIDQSNGKIEVRWYLTQGEQYHTKILGVFRSGETTLIGGSANYTRRNLDNYNMETDLMVTVHKDDTLSKDFKGYFDRIWVNRDGIYTDDFSEYEDNSVLKKLIYRFQEKTGLGTF